MGDFFDAMFASGNMPFVTTPLVDLFQHHHAVLFGDDLDNLCLKPPMVSHFRGPLISDMSAQKSEWLTKCHYAGIVALAHASGIRHVAVDMPELSQAGIDSAMNIYRTSLSEGVSFNHLVHTMITNVNVSPMDIAVGTSAFKGMAVHAANVGFSGIASLCRAISYVPQQSAETSVDEAFSLYLEKGFDADRRALNKLLRRQATGEEVVTMLDLVKVRLGRNGDSYEAIIMDEVRTVDNIRNLVSGEAFIGFFDAKRLFVKRNGPYVLLKDLERAARSVLGETRVVTVAMPDAVDPSLTKLPLRRLAANLSISSNNLKPSSSVLMC